MKFSIDLKISELRNIARQLTKKQLIEVRDLVDNEIKMKQDTGRKAKLQKILKKGPVFDDGQLEMINEANKTLNS